MQKILEILKNKKGITIASGVVVFSFILFFITTQLFKVTYDATKPVALKAEVETKKPAEQITVLDTVAYDKKMVELANHIFPPAPKPAVTTATNATPAKPVTLPKPPIWPAKAVYPNAGALLPFNRIVAYYGNFYAKGMGALGQYPPEEMKRRLLDEVAKWQTADPTTPVIPAVDYIAVTAQGSAGADGKYRFRMPDSEIDKAIKIAGELKGIVILEIQPGLSNFHTEVPIFEKYLKMPNVHLALDPEFSMQTANVKPGRVIGTVDAVEVNAVAQYLAKLVKDNNLPPKVLIIHRFTHEMVTNTKQIHPLPEVQVLMDMDGWGSPAKKIGTHRQVIYPEPVQFTGFKLFYKNDFFAPSTRMLTREEILKLEPRPSFIQYQ
jgi:hypothetical protein